ncbi:TPA: phage tail protein [Salmonella enterica subsp. enterica serovar Muenchen]
MSGASGHARTQTILPQPPPANGKHVQGELPYLLSFLEEHGAYKAFLWQPSVVNRTIKVVCREWDVKAQNLYADVLCQFDEVIVWYFDYF